VVGFSEKGEGMIVCMAVPCMHNDKPAIAMCCDWQEQVLMVKPICSENYGNAARIVRRLYR
jgi:hypothetical protein